MAALAAILALGCSSYPGTATTKVTYYDPQGRITIQIEHSSSWRQAEVIVPIAGEAAAPKVRIDHEAMSGEGGLAGAWGALIGFLAGLGLGFL